VFCVFPQETSEGTLRRLRGIAAQHGWRYVDLYTVYSDYLRDKGLKDFTDLYVRRDDPHPTPVGHQLIAAALEPAIIETLASHSRGSTGQPAEN
jgi:lysophospholipase L1-like esterase